MSSPTEENYLKAILTLAGQHEGVTASELSNLLQVRLPTINSMVNKLKKQGLINYERYKPLSLTEAGKKRALTVIRKHRLAEMFLSQKMGFGWEEVHEIAEQLEHIDSEALFERMDEILEFPDLDPHGLPIPDKNGKMNQISYDHLSNCHSGQIVKLIALSNDSTDFINFLNNRELNLGTIIEIKAKENYDQSMIVSYKNHPSETFSKDVCDSLLVIGTGSNTKSIK